MSDARPGCRFVAVQHDTSSMKIGTRKPSGPISNKLLPLKVYVCPLIPLLRLPAPTANNSGSLQL